MFIKPLDIVSTKILLSFCEDIESIDFAYFDLPSAELIFTEMVGGKQFISMKTFKNLSSKIKESRVINFLRADNSSELEILDLTNYANYGLQLIQTIETASHLD